MAFENQGAFLSIKLTDFVNEFQPQYFLTIYMVVKSFCVRRCSNSSGRWILCDTLQKFFLLASGFETKAFLAISCQIVKKALFAPRKYHGRRKNWKRAMLGREAARVNHLGA